MADGKKISELTESATIEDAHYFPVSDGTDTTKVAYSTIKNDLIDYSEELAEVISPTVTPTEIEGGVRLTITDIEGTKTANILNGSPNNIDYVRWFETVADMQAAIDLQAGMMCHTNGFHSAGDGGAAYYTVSASGTANGMDVLACGEMYANLVTPEIGNPMAYGAYGDDTHDDSAAFGRCIELHDYTLIPPKTYLLNSTISVGAGKTLEGPEATLHGTASVVMNVQSYMSSQIHTALPIYIKGLAFKGDNTNTLLQLHNALKVSVTGTRYYDFATAFEHDAGYELYVDDFRAVGSNANAVGIHLSTGDCIINNVMMRDVHTAIKLESGHGRYTFNNVHCWIYNPDYFENSTMFDTSVVGGRDCICNNFYFDTYHKPIIKRGACYDVFTNPVVTISASVAEAAEVSAGTFITFVESQSFNKKLYNGKVEINGYIASLIVTDFYSLVNDTTIKFKFTFGAAADENIASFLAEMQANLYTLDENVTLAQGRIDMTPEYIVINGRISLPANYTSSSTKNTIVFNDRIRFESTTMYAFSWSPNTYCTVYANKNYINFTPAATGANNYIINIAIPYNFKP